MDYPTGTRVRYKGEQEPGGLGTVVHPKDIGTGPYPENERLKTYDIPLVMVDEETIPWLKSHHTYPYYVGLNDQWELADQLAFSCPKCQSTDTEYIVLALANKCRNCWHTWT